MSLICSEHAEALGEDMGGTAPPEPLVLVLEQPGPWGPKAPVPDELAARAAAAGARVQVVRRRTGRYTTERPAAWLAGFEPGRRFLERLDLDLPGDLEPGAGTPETEPLFLVCTHSTRDPCCARRGLPLQRALAATATPTWHSSHLGGHRFAATMAALPLGAWLGRVPAEAAGEVARLLRAGRLPLAHMRGLAGRPPAVQAAELAVRRREGLDGVDDLAVEAFDGDRHVRLRAADGRRFTLDAVLEPTGVIRALSCGPGAKTEDPGRWVVTVA